MYIRESSEQTPAINLGNSSSLSLSLARAICARTLPSFDIIFLDPQEPLKNVSIAPRTWREKKVRARASHNTRRIARGVPRGADVYILLRCIIVGVERI